MARIKSRWHFIAPYLKKYRLSVISGVAMVVLSTGLDQIPPWMIKNIVDRLSCYQKWTDQGRSLESFCLDTLGKNFTSGQAISVWSLIGGPLLVILIATLVSALLLFFQRWLVISASRKIEYEIRGDLFSRFQAQPKAFTDANKIGDLMSHATNDLDKVRDFLGPVILHLARMPFLILFTLTAVILLSPKLALVGIIPVMILPLFVNKFMRKMHKLYGQIQKNLGALNSFIQDSISGIQVVKAYAKEKEFQEKFKDSSSELRDNSIRVSFLTSAMWPLIGGLASFGVLLVVWYGSSLAMKSQVSMGVLMAVIIYLLKLQFPLAGLGWIANLFQRASASLDRLIELYTKFEKPPKEAPISPASMELPADTSCPEIDLRKLSYAYADSVTVLKGIQLKIPSASRLGIVGPTGAGKTTLMHVICGVYSPPPDQLFLNGKPREHFSAEIWQRYFSLSPQDGFLFSTTIEDNIALGQTKRSELDVKAAGRLSAFDTDLVQIPNGYAALLGERGINLSGGQRQRVGLARAMMSNANIVCLDDTLSALDSETESRVLENLRSNFSQSTLIIVAHRYSAVKDCDQIIYLEEGCIVESGNHGELIALQGKYASVYEKQQISEELEQS